MSCMRRAREWVWVAAAVPVVFAYGFGRAVWSPGFTSGFGRVPFDWSHDILVFLVLGGAPAAIGGLLLCSKAAWRRWLGFAVIAVTATGLAGMAFFWSFAGFCLDPGEDTCVVTRPAHVAHLIAPLAALAVGWQVTLWRQRQNSPRVTA